MYTFLGQTVLIYFMNEFVTTVNNYNIVIPADYGEYTFSYLIKVRKFRICHERMMYTLLRLSKYSKKRLSYAYTS